MDKKKLQDILSKYFDLIDPNNPDHVSHLVGQAHLFHSLSTDNLHKELMIKNPHSFLSNAYDTFEGLNENKKKAALEEIAPLENTLPAIVLSDEHKAKIRDVMASYFPDKTATNSYIDSDVHGMGTNTFGALFDNKKQYEDYMEKMLLPVLNTKSNEHERLWRADSRLQIGDDFKFNATEPEKYTSGVTYFQPRQEVLHHLSRLLEKYPEAKLNLPLDYFEDIPSSSHLLNIAHLPNVNVEINRKIAKPDLVGSVLGQIENVFHHHPEIVKKLQNRLGEKAFEEIDSTRFIKEETANVIRSVGVDGDYVIPKSGGGIKAQILTDYLDEIGHRGSKELVQSKIDSISKKDMETARDSLHPLLNAYSSYVNFDPKTEDQLVSLFDQMNQKTQAFNPESSNYSGTLSKVYDTLWAKKHNSKHKDAARFWNSYEEDVGNHHFPIVHAAMTGQHQQHRPYRKDKPGGDKEWVDSKGSDDLWSGLHQHAKVSQAALLDLIHNDKMKPFFRKNAKGDIYVKVMRGVGGKYSKIVAMNHKLGGKIPVAPIQSWTLDPATAMQFSNNNKSVGGETSQTVMHAWLPLKNLVHYGKMTSHAFKPVHADETELIFHHPESMISLEKIHDPSDSKDKDVLRRQINNMALPETTFKDIKNIHHHLANDLYWKNIADSVRLKTHSETKKTSKDPRYWADKFGGLSFDSPEDAQHYMKWSFGVRKGVDAEQMTSHFSAVPNSEGKFTLGIKPESMTSLEAADKAILEKKARKGLNSHLINSPKYWKQALGENPATGYKPDVAKSKIEEAVQKFNKDNAQSLSPEHVHQFIEIRPAQFQFLSHVSEEDRNEAKGNVEFYMKDKYQVRQDRHDKGWHSMIGTDNKEAVGEQTYMSRGYFKKGTDETFRHIAFSRDLPKDQLMEKGRQRLYDHLSRPASYYSMYEPEWIKKPENAAKIKQNIDQNFHKFYKPRKIAIGGHNESDHVIFEPIDPLEKK